MSSLRSCSAGHACRSFRWLGRCATITRRSGRAQSSKRPLGGVPSGPIEARRSLKTQQHAHRLGHPYRPIRVCVQVRPWQRSRPSGPALACQARNQAVQQYPVEAPGLASVYWRPLVWRNRQDSFVRAVLHGEFDPGSGRTLAACLTHASGATNRGLPRGRAANG